MPSDFFAIDGRVMPARDATVSVLDLGFLRGIGAFETLRTYAGHPHGVTEHLRRLWTAAAVFGVEACFTAADLRRVISEIRVRSGHDELRVNLVVTPGENTHGVFGAEQPTWVAIAREVHAPPDAWYADGVAAITFPGARLLPELKTTSYLSGRPGLLAAERAGAHEAFYVDATGCVSEGVTSNVALLHGGCVTTPAGACLRGLTKDGLRPLAEAAGLRWLEASITVAQLLAADEVWITSAVRELLPIVRLDGQPIAGGVVGPWARRLRPLYHQQCIDEAKRDARAAG